MVKNLQIKNYKSIESLDIETKRVNVFIGEHNSGKSNILEALSWFSPNVHGDGIYEELFRFRSASDFFRDFDTQKEIEVKTNLSNLLIEYAKNSSGAYLNYFDVWLNTSDESPEPMRYKMELSGLLRDFDGPNQETNFRVYSFKRQSKFLKSFAPFLNPPFGDNLTSILIANKHLRDLVSAIFREKGFRMILKPAEMDINMAKDINDELYAFNYVSISETMQRIVFYLLAIESNKDAILVLDEPESNTFPMYTKQLAELMALDPSNQYFIATHNPYLLGSLISKTPSKDIAVFVASMEDYKTIVRPVESNRLSEILDLGYDFFFNMDKLVEA